jgi:hypothetical protein
MQGEYIGFKVMSSEMSPNPIFQLLQDTLFHGQSACVQLVRSESI